MEPSTQAKRVVDDYTAWRDYTKEHRKEVERYWKQYNNQRTKPAYKSKVKFAVDPMVHQVVESRVDNIYGSRPQWTFMPTMSEQETDTDILSGMAEYSWDKANMDLHIMPIGREQEITGNVIVFHNWEDGCMTYQHIPWPDCIGDCAAPNPYEAKKVGFVRYAMIEDLKKELRFDPTIGEKDEDGNPEGAWVKKYNARVLAKVKTFPSLSQGDASAKAMAERIYRASTLPESEKAGQVQIVHMRYLDKFIEVANEQQAILEFDNPFQAPEREVDVQAQDDDGQRLYGDEDPEELANRVTEANIAGEPPPEFTDEEIAEAAEKPTMKITVPAIEPFLGFSMGRLYINPAAMIAKGTVETISDLYEELQDHIGIKKDNLVYREQNVILYDDSQPGLVGKMANATPNSMVPARGIAEGKIPLHWLEKPDLAADADVEINRIKQEIRDTARVDQVIQGVAAQNDRTATEIDAQVAGASSGFKTQTRTLGAGLYKMMGENFYKLSQIFMTKEQLVRVVGPKGVEFKKFSPDNYFGPYDVKVVLKQEAEAAKKQEAEQALAAFDRFRQSPNWNQVELERYVAEKALDIPEDRLKLLMSPDPMNQAALAGAPVGDVVGGTAPGLPAGGPM